MNAMPFMSATSTLCEQFDNQTEPKRDVTARPSNPLCYATKLVVLHILFGE